MSEKAKLEKSLETIEQKMLRAEKRKQEQAVNQITSLKEKLFPGNQLQERVENFLPFYQKYGNEMLTELIASLNPLQKEFVILTE